MYLYTGFSAKSSPNDWILLHLSYLVISNEAVTTLRPRLEASPYRGPWVTSHSNVFSLKENLVLPTQTLLTPDGNVWALLSVPEGQATSEYRHLYPPVQESSYGSPLTPAKRPKRKVAPKRRQERPVAPPKKRRRKLHRMDHYAAETRQDKVSLSTVPNLCGGQVWPGGCLRCLSLKVVWVRFKRTAVFSLALSLGPSGTLEVNSDVKTSCTFSTTGKKKGGVSLIFFKVSWPQMDVAI